MFRVIGFCLEGASKIAPHGFSLPTERNVLSFQLFQSHVASLPEGPEPL